MNYTNFAAYIKDLEIDHQYPPEALLNGIEQILRSNMRKRGLWNAPPALLGKNYSNYSEDSWNNANGFQDLIFDCYLEVIVKRIEGLRKALLKFDNIDGLIIRNVQNFLTELQKRNNPISYGVAVNVKKAIQLAIDSEKLTAQYLDESGKIQNKTLLIFSSTQSTITENSLLECLRSNKAWAEIRLKLARRSQSVQAKFCEIVCELANCGIKSFVFKELHELVDAEIRQFNEPVKTVSIDEIPENDLGTLGIDTTHEDWESWNYIVNQVEKSIAQIPQKRVRERLQKIFLEEVSYSKTDEPMPSQAELARSLGIPSSTLNEDMKILKNIVRKYK